VSELDYGLADVESEVDERMGVDQDCEGDVRWMLNGMKIKGVWENVGVVARRLFNWYVGSGLTLT